MPPPRPHPRIPLPLSLPIPTPPPPLPPSLRTSLTSVLLSSGSIHTIHHALLTAAESSGWLESVRARALEVLREGEGGGERKTKTKTTYWDVVDTIMREARPPRENAAGTNDEGSMRSANGGGAAGAERQGGPANGVMPNGHATARSAKRSRADDSSELASADVDADGEGGGGGRAAGGGAGAGKRRKVSVRVPGSVVGEGVKVVREALGRLVDVVEVGGG